MQQIDRDSPDWFLCKCGVAFEPFHFAGPPDRGIMDECPNCGELCHFTPRTLRSLNQIEREENLRLRDFEERPKKKSMFDDL